MHFRQKDTTQLNRNLAGSGIGIILVCARKVLLPVGESIAVIITVKQIEINPAEVAIHLGQVETSQRTIPIANVFPDFVSLRISVSGSVDKYLKIISCTLGDI